MSKLDKEERALLQTYEKGEWKSSEKIKGEIRRFQRYARATIRKNKRINIRISSKDLEGVQRRALEEGIPYQTLISSIIHKYAAGALIERGP